MHILFKKPLSFKSSRKLLFPLFQTPGEISSEKNKLTALSSSFLHLFPFVLPQTLTEHFAVADLECRGVHVDRHLCPH